MLAVQLVACHAAAVRALRLLKGSQTIPQPDTNGNLAVKLMRTFTLRSKPCSDTEARDRRRSQSHAFMSMPATKPLLARSRQSAANQGRDHEEAAHKGLCGMLATILH
jgi:hypothetical protein